MNTKSRVLKILERKCGEDVSGQAIAEELGITRNSVWKAVNALREDGFAIESGTNRGYRLDRNNDLVSAASIAQAFEHAHPELELRVFDELDSTQDEARRMIASGFAGVAAIVARQQESGHGRRGRSFFSPAGGVYATLVVNGSSLSGDAASMTMCAAVSTARAIASLCDCRPLIKWVNDIYVEGRKVCGILSEGVADLESGTMSSVSIGIGVNVGEQDFPSDIADKAGFVELAPGKTRSQLVAAIIENLLDSGVFHACEDAEANDIQNVRTRILEEYRELSLVIGMQVDYEMGGCAHAGRALAIDDDGGLVVLDDDGDRHVLRAGEISIRF